MSGNYWQAQTQHNYRNTLPSSDTPVSGSAYDSDPLQSTHRLLTAYPLASATPAVHVTRHLSNLSLTAAPPSFYIQPVSDIQHPTSYSQYYPTQYAEYSNELEYLNGSSDASRMNSYWESAKTNAARYVGQQEVSPHYSPHSWQPHHAPSNHQTSAFAQHVFQQSTPSALYPTPPPPGISTSSSSLAFALGEPVQRPVNNVHRPSESSKFFDGFLAQQTVPSLEPRTPHRQSVPAPKDSPDPLAFSSPSIRDAAVTPRKRKAVPASDFSPAKRAHSNGPHTTPRAQDTNGTTSSTTSTPKQKMQVYVELPPVPKFYRTPSRTQLGSSARRLTSSDKDEDLGGFRSDDLREASGHSHSSGRGSSAAKHAPMDKLVTLLEDIFEAEDNVSPDNAVSDLPTEFFSPLTVDCSRPLLHPNILRKLTNYVGKVTRPSKRLRLSSRDKNGAQNTPKSSGRVSHLDVNMLSRVIKLLERSVQAGEDVDPFKASTENSPLGASPVKSRKSSGGKQKHTGRSQTPRSAEGDVDMAGSPEPPDVNQQDYGHLSTMLYVARDSVLAADCCIALLSSDRLPKQLYSEELITTCFATIKNQLTKIVYPFAEASADVHGHIPPVLQYLSRASSLECDAHRRQLGELFQAVISVVPRVNALICSEYASMSEGIIIQAVYIAVGPFFMAEAGDKDKKGDVVLNTLGASSMRGLRLDALTLIRSIFANYEEQRAWIIEEILSSLIKLSDNKQKSGQFRLRDGRSIRTVSALLLQLVQTSARDVRVGTQSLHKSRQHANTLRMKEGYGDAMEGVFLDESDMAEIRLYTTGLESATKAAKTIILFLTQRSGKGKSTKDSNEAEYRAIFDSLISDLLTVLFWPEWPAASLLLTLACRYMVSSMDDVKTASANDNNAAKTMALDHLGLIAARLRTTTKRFSDGPSKLLPLDDILTTPDADALSTLSIAHQAVDTHLLKKSSEDQAYVSARELATVVWGQELAFALKQCSGLLEDGDDGKVNEQVDQKRMLVFCTKMKKELHRLWTDPASDVFDMGSTQEETLRIDLLSEEIGMVQSLKNMFYPILNVVLSALEAPPVFMRTKALRALGQIITSDPSILSTQNVRTAIEGHLLDSSPAVRDAAVELIGKYMIDSPEFAGHYYAKIAERIADTGLSVRKRVIKLLKSFYSVTEDTSRHIDICARLVFRMFDEDDSVKDLALRAMEELWFHDASPTSGSHKRTPLNPHDKLALLSKVAVIMGVSATFKDRQSPLEDLLHQIIVGKNVDETSSLHLRYAEICEVLIDGLVDASDLPGFTVVNCVRTIHLFTAAHPAVLSTTHASTLLPYLKNATTPEEQTISDYLLRIFRASIPQFPKTAIKFGQDLQLALQPMVLKPSPTAGILGLQETVACMCAIVQHLTHDFVRLIALLRSCNIRLQQTLRKPAVQQLSSTESRALTILIFIAALLCEHCDFDQLRTENEGLSVEIDSITETSIIEHVYRSLISLYEKYNAGGLRGRILQCLGFLFRAQPTLLTADASATIMDAIFASDEEDGRTRLLKIMQDFLLSEADKQSTEQKDKMKLAAKTSGDVNMQELVGNTDGFADSGVSSAIVQRYIDQILMSALSVNPQMQAAAVDILSFTVKQGLAHPLQLFPVIVALETNPSSTLSNRASALHAILHGKHSSLLNARYVPSARASFDYQKRICSDHLQGYRTSTTPTALLQRWYSLVRDKRASRQDFLKALIKVFDVEMHSSSFDDVAFARYMAENFATFEYKTQEEVLTVIKYLTAVLSTTGMQVVEIISPSHLLSQLHGGQNPEAIAVEPPPPQFTLDSKRMPLICSSIIVAIIMLLKTHLKAMYGISEEKCSKWVIGKKSAIGDRPASRRHERPITWDRLPFAIRPILTHDDVASQQTTFLEIWNEDGLTAEPEDD